MKKICILLLALLALTTACEIKIKPNEEFAGDINGAVVRRYDRLQSRYLTTGDFSALQQMNTEYPMETRTLIEDVLQLGEVNDPEINSKFLKFYQDTTLQSIIADAEAQYANMGDINKQFAQAFKNLEKLLPGIAIPEVYTQIGALNQSIVIGNNSIGISLDKYLGANYQPYKKFYNEQQRSMMSREYIVTDALNFYILSLYPLKQYYNSSQDARDLHMGRVMWLVNKATGKELLKTRYSEKVEAYMKAHPKAKAIDLLKENVGPKVD